MFAVLDCGSTQTQPLDPRAETDFINWVLSASIMTVWQHAEAAAKPINWKVIEVPSDSCAEDG